MSRGEARPETIGELTAPTPAGWSRWQARFEFLLVDAATLTAEDGQANPVAALLRLLVARFAGVEESDEHRLRQALRYMEEPVMLAEAITEWRQEAIAEGRTKGRTEGVREGASEGRRTLLRRQATRRYGLEAGDEFGRLLAGEEDVDRLELAGDLVIDCSSAEELLRRGRRLLGDGNGAP